MSVDNSRFTEEQRTEAFRTELMQLALRQTRAAESTRAFVGWLLGITVGLLVLELLVGVGLN